MPPKKKAKLPSSNDPHESNEPEDPTEFIGYIRNESGKRFSATNWSKGEHNSDIEQNVREVRAILKINAEIFVRCMESRVENYNTDDDVEDSWGPTYSTSFGGTSSRLQHNKKKLKPLTFKRFYESEDEDDAPAAKKEPKTTLTFKRSGYDVVKVRQCPTNTDKTEIITYLGRDQKMFSIKSLCEIPTGLNDLVVTKHQKAPYEAFIDYNAFFRTAITLHDDILEPFLVKLKQHLESIQVCLGEIESWLLEPKSNIQFLEETFGKKLERVQLGRDQVLTTYSESGRFEKTFTLAKVSDQQKLKNFLVFMGN